MIEKKLREAPLLAPSTTLDQNIQALIRDSARHRRNLIWRPVPLWTSVAACLAFALLGFFAARLVRLTGPQTESQQVIYVVEPTHALRRLVHARAPKSSPGFFQTKTANVEVFTPSSKRSELLSFEEGL